MTDVGLRPCGESPSVAARRPSTQTAVDLLDEAARRVVHTVRLWRQRVRDRNDLARLDERALADIGLTPGDREFLVGKPFWRE